MARPPQDAIETFMSITGASEAVAIVKLEEHGGDLNEAVNAFFSEGDRVNTLPASIPDSHTDYMNIDDPINIDSSGPALPLLSAAHSFNPFSLLDPLLGRNIFDGTTEFANSAPRVSFPKEVREIHIEFKDGNNQPGSSGHRPSIEDVTGSISENVPGVHGTVILDDDDLPTAPAEYGAGHAGDKSHTSNDISVESRPGPSFPQPIDAVEYNNDIEEEMIRAAIEASKRETDGFHNEELYIPENASNPPFGPRPPASDDVELARAVSLSLKTAEQERALREQGGQIREKTSSPSSAMHQDDLERLTLPNGRQENVSSKAGTSAQLNMVEGTLSVQDEDEDLEELPLVRHRSRRLTSGNNEPTESGQVIDSLPSSHQQHGVAIHPLENGDAFPSDEWGGMSSEEHDEAVMLEAAMFGGVPEGASYQLGYPHHQFTGSERTNHYPRVHRPPSPTLTAQRLLKEQQDDEYLASLQADQEKEMKALQEAELRRLEEVAAKEVALEREKRQEEEKRRKQQEEEEFERLLAAKEATLPQEPSINDESSVTLLVRMPDGSRRGRRFLKSDKLQFLLDFIDVGRVVKPGSYKLVRPYPRRAFTDEESQMSLSELGLTSKQEALFLELISGSFI